MKRGLSANFSRKFPEGPEIRVENLEVREAAGITVLFGASGVGKTTVLRCLAGLDRPDSGEIRFGEETWFEAAQGKFFPPRSRGVGFVPQEFALFPHLSVEHNIGYGLKGLPASALRSRVSETMNWLGLEGLEGRMPSELSGGQQQRVALARAVAPKPRLLLLDEPLSALDVPTRQRVRGELRRLLLKLQSPTILVTHDRAEALALGDEILVLEGGRIAQRGAPGVVFNRPASLGVAALVGMETVEPGRVARVEAGLATVAVGSVELLAVADELPEEAVDVLVCIRSGDVILTGESEAATSARNRLRAKVQSITPEGLLMSIELDCGFGLKALLTRQACEDLELKPGGQVVALIKAPNIHLIAR